MQEATDVVAELSVEMPVGHGVQLDAPAAEYEPAAHATQPVALVVPPLVTVPAKPGAQIEHDDTEEPALVEKIPTGHVMAQPAALADPPCVTVPV